MQRRVAVLGAVGSHAVDTIRYLVGEIDAAQALLETSSDPARATEGDFAGTRDVTADDFAAVHLRLRNGALAR